MRAIGDQRPGSHYGLERDVVVERRELADRGNLRRDGVVDQHRPRQPFAAMDDAVRDSRESRPVDSELSERARERGGAVLALPVERR